MKNIVLVILLSGVTLLGYGQAVNAPEEAVITFEETSHDFGTLDKNAPAETTFAFTNSSDEPVKLRNVKASCGCTTPAWTKDAVQPGAQGEIKVKYNTSRVGPFTKSITVYYDSLQKPVVLYIRGKVEEAQAQEAMNYNEVLGGIAFHALSQHVGTVASDSSAKVDFHLKNVSPNPIELTLSPESSQSVSLEMPNTSIAPGGKMKISATVSGESIENEGVFNLPIVLETNEEELARKELQITGTLKLVEVAPQLMPSVKFAQQTYDAGKVLAGEKVNHAFTFTNEGEGDLIIESVKASCGCTATAPKDKIIKPGASSEITATFDSRGRSGMQNKSITVKTNDPNQGTLILRLKVEVEKDPFHAGEQGPVANPSGRSSF